MTDLVHNNGANIIGQLHIVRDIDISVEEIKKIPDLFADATLRAKKAGFDGIEIVANHHVFLSKLLIIEMMNMVEVMKIELESL